MIHCPVCRVANPHGPNCRRCKADLTLLFAVRQHHHDTLHQAGAALRSGDLPRARRLLADAHALRADAETRRVQCLLALAEARHGDALALHAGGNP